MSDYQHFVAEREKIDFLIEKGFIIKSVTENLSGAFLELERIKQGKVEKEKLHILTADARKYFSGILIQQL
ncbi:hypothetical protein [Priestia flexa]|uniref:Uncharacterized protein n=1 Tax=Priestia flexa TaxID=86664 RepID=A0A1N6N7K7_9BACI|nr:hypothetical protein [Priestia flexa]MBN8250318.1 hypothetical protein [Priestia flexa]MBY6085031.1 hypothetical protein [Priestia flexa]SIP88060.1 hypothetical protein SAMN05880580_101134 [Priestia flexa]